MKCPQCGTDQPDNAKFCNECGAPLATASTAQATISAGARAAVDRSLSKGGDRRLVTVLFADVSGFTGLAENLDPEQLRDLITGCFDRLVPCIMRYGGTIDKFIGDEIMALFGAPRAHEDDPERSLRAALEMRNSLVSFNREHRVSLALHFGVNTGLVYAGGVGGGGRDYYSVMGDAVNIAARLKTVAQPGEIVVGVDTYRQVDQGFSWGEVGPVSLKGKAEPVTAYRLLDVRTASSAPRWTQGLSSPLVGREAELAAVMHRLVRLRDGEGGVIVITGEPGLGKSRLVAEARADAQGQCLTWLEGRTLSFSRTLSYWPFLEIIQQDAGIDGDDSEAERWGKLAGRTTSLFGEETPEILPYLATLLSLPVPEDLDQIVRHLDGEAMGRQVYRATRRFFARLARERPTVVLIEDVHWLDCSSASLIEHLLPLAREAPIVFCLVARPEQDSALTHLHDRARADCAACLTEIALSPLSLEESAVLVRNLVQVKDLPGRTKEAILAKTEGNPFFVEEVVQSLIDLGGLVRDTSNGHWQVTEKATRINIPDTLHGVIMARVDHLDDGLQRVLRLASVVGRNFFYRVLENVAQTEHRLDESLAILEARELIRQQARTQELEYVFKHALVQEATYESILLRDRREVHARVARAIETLFPDRQEEFLGLLAYHYTKAEAWDEAEEYLLAAGRHAGRLAADPETLAHFEQALEAHLRAHGGTWGDLISDEGIDWFLEWTDAIHGVHRLGSVVRAIRAFYENVLVALGPQDQRVWAVGLVLGRAHVQRLEAREAEQVLQSILEYQEREGCLGAAYLGRTLYLLAQARGAQGRYSESEAAFKRARDIGRSEHGADSQEVVDSSCLGLSALYTWLCRWDDARLAIAEGLRESKSQVGPAYAFLLMNLSGLEWAVGEYDAAEKHARACMDQAAHPLERAGALDSLGLVRLHQGLYAEAEECFAAAVTIREPFGEQEGLDQSFSNLAEARLQQGRLQGAEQVAERALGIVTDHALGDFWSVSPFLTLAGVALARGELGEAERLLVECLTIMEKAAGPSHYVQPEVLYRMARLRRLQGRTEEAEELLQEACRLLDERRQDSLHPRAEAMRAEWARGRSP